MSVLINGINYTLDTTNKTATVVALSSDSYYEGDIVIPETVVSDSVTYNVTAIGDSAFTACSGLISIVMPNSITRIEDYAFCWCDNLNSISLPNSLIYLGVESFSNSGLISIVIPNSVTSIGLGAFDSCLQLISVIINSNSISKSMFANCVKLENVTISNNVNIIREAAFLACIKLKSINIPNSVNTIERVIFDACTALKFVNIYSKIINLWGEEPFTGCTILQFINIPSSIYATYYAETNLSSVKDKLVAIDEIVENTRTIPINSNTSNYHSFYKDYYDKGVFIETDTNNIYIKGNLITIKKLSELLNDSEFITKAVNDLTNYYLKDETYTKPEINDLISSINSFHVAVVTDLPTENISTNTIYFKLKTPTETNNIYNEYIYINSAWELIGDTTIDLSNYYNKTEIDDKLATKQDIFSYSTNNNIDSANIITVLNGLVATKSLIFLNLTTETVSQLTLNLADLTNLPTLKPITILIQNSVTGSGGFKITVNDKYNSTGSRTAINDVGILDNGMLKFEIIKLDDNNTIVLNYLL